MRFYLNCIYLVMVSILFIGFATMSVAQFSASGCWDLTTEASCNSDNDTFSCIWRSSNFGDSWGWCEKTSVNNCWQYSDNSTCISNGCSWNTFGYCYRESCWDFRDKTSCEQAKIKSNGSLNCKWETMGTADTSDDYCYEVGCWTYQDNDTCTAAGCTWGSMGGGWCEESGCWNYETEMKCNAQENCEWNGGSNCRFKSCWDYTTQEDCENSSLNCVWDSAGLYCSEMGCWAFNDQTGCENNPYNLTCNWDSDGNYCYEPSCHDYTLQTDCESTSDDLTCEWDSTWGECHELGCWSYTDQTNCDSDSNCVWRRTGFCYEQECWSFEDEVSCNNNSYGLDCSWHSDPHCEGPPEYNCWEYNDQTNCENSGCEWREGWCSEPGCFDFQTNETCMNTSDNYNCIWNSDEHGEWCDELGCWIFHNQTECENNNYNLTCAWDNESMSCFKRGCWDYNNENECTDLGLHPDVICEWDNQSNFCYEPGCSSYKNNDTCIENGCGWKWDSGFCEEKVNVGVDCWSFENNATCSEHSECVWDEWGSCEDKKACWKQSTKVDCESLSNTRRCVWDSEGQYCYEKGCWEYTNQTNCESAGCSWDGASCFEEGCWKYNDENSCLDLNDSLNCRWKSNYVCYQQGCWDYTDQSSCVSHNCVWQTGGWCEATTPGAECWQYWDPASCNGASDCNWTENSWCEEPGPWQYNTQTDCEGAGFSWKVEGGWCSDPSDLQCWNFNQSVCDTKPTCRWDEYSQSCINRECWEYPDNDSCNNAPEELGCEWRSESQGPSGWCEELDCWSFTNQPDCVSHKTDMQCTWATFGWCEERNCFMLESESACLNMSDNLDCSWENATNPEGGVCEPEFGRWDVDCGQYWNNATECNNADGCRWRTGWCNEPGCWQYDESTCENSSLHPNINCTWHSDGMGGGWCEDKGCWNFWTEEECNNHNADMGCEWHQDSWNPQGGWCEEPGCWSYHDNESCSNAVVKGKNCVWQQDPGGFGGWCAESGCMLHTDQNSCNADSACVWRTESHCERARCWMWDSMNGGNETICINKGIEFGLNCTWQDPWCEEAYSECDAYDNDKDGCFATGFCWWDEPTQTCNNPGEEWLGELENEKINPGCWIFDYSSDYCNENYVDVCRWNNATDKCVGISADVEIKCVNIKDSELCESIPVLATCCEWKNNKCQAAPDSTRCYMAIEEPPEGAKFCEDYVAYTDETTCKKIAGAPWFMPCKWDGEHCVFRAEDKFGGEKKGCDSITNKKDCEFAGCEWKTDFYCEGETAVPFGWCEERTGFGAKSCDAACWACEFQPDGSNWNSEAEAQSACEGSALGYCTWISDPNAPNGLGYCEIPDDVKYAGDCSTDCKACEKKSEPQTACESSPAECKWVEDTMGATEIGGWCYPKSEKSCSEDCFRCYDEVSCVNYGGGSKGTCLWDSNILICKPKSSDKEICFDGIDNNGNDRVDCEDSDCFSDPFCGSGMISDCWKYETKEDCLSEGNASNCIWIVDPWENKEWCGMRGENCFLWDGDEAGCNNQPMCDWFPDPMGGFCEIDNSITKDCFKATTQGACSLKSDCTWEIDPTSPSGGVCEAKIFKCEDKTSQSECTSGEWSSRCEWIIDSETGQGECEPICFSNDLKTQSACDNNPNCKWMSGFCDPAEQFGMKMDECWKYDNDPDACANATGCEYHMEMGGGFCDLNFTLNDMVCMNLRNQTACDADPMCSWKGDSLSGWCDLRVFSCGWYQDENECNNDPQGYGGCAWVNDSFCDGPPEFGCWQYDDDQNACEQASGCEWRGPRCEPKCFSQPDQSSCNNEAPICSWRQGFCEPKMMKMMFGGMENKPVDLGGDEDGCGQGDIPPELDICGFGVKDMPDNYGFGAGVVSLENAALCKGKKIVKAGPMGSQVITDSGTGTNTTKFYLYLDTDGSDTGNCYLWNNQNETGYEFFFKYVVKIEDGEVKEIRTAYRCKDGNWVIADIKLSGWRTLMCSEIGGFMVAINKDDLKKFSDLFIPGEKIRVYVATAGSKRTKTNPVDTAGPGYYTPGAIDFKFEDCLTPGVDMDGDGFNSENDPDCFAFYKNGGFIKHEDCFETGIDEDDDGLVDCDDPDCKFAPNCVGKGANLMNDSTPPRLVWSEVDEYPDAAFIKYDTDEPANGTIQFYYTDSSCNALNKTIKDPALLDTKTINDYKNWHDGPIDNFEFNPQKLGYDLTNGTTYYYKLKVCDPSGNCAISTCLNFTTARSDSKIDCPDCYVILPGEKGACGVAKKKVSYKNVTDIPLTAGNETAIVIENVKGKSFDEPNITMDNITTTDGNSAGYVGMSADDYDRIRSKLGAYTDINCTIKIPKGPGGDCDKLWHCPDPVNGVVDMSKCEDRTSDAELIDETDEYCEWKVPCDFSVWMSDPGEGGGGTSTSTSTTPTTLSGGSSGGGGGISGTNALPSCFDGIKNCHDGLCEEGVDCGGPCDPCMSCSDGIQNQGEEGVDCGGPCSPCVTTTVTTTTAVVTTTVERETTTTAIVSTTTTPVTTSLPTTTTTVKEEKSILSDPIIIVPVVFVITLAILFLITGGGKKGKKPGMKDAGKHRDILTIMKEVNGKKPA